MSVAEIRERIHLYLSAYYDELRKQMARYHTMSQAFPGFLKGHRQMVAVLGEDGVVVTHWTAEQDTFEFYEANKSIVDIANEQLGGGLQWKALPGIEIGSLKVAGVEIRQGTDPARPLPFIGKHRGKFWRYRLR